MSVPQIDQSLLQQIGAAVRRRISVGSLQTASGRAGAVDIGRVELGEASVDQVTIRDFDTTLTCGAALLREVRAILELHFEVRWSYDLKWFGSDAGTKVLGSKAKTIPLHDIRIPMLQDIAITVPEASAADVNASVAPVTDTALGALAFRDARLETTRLPASGFRLAGLEFRAVEIDRFAVADADTARVTIAEAAPEEPLRFPTVELENIRLPDIEVPDVTSPEPVSIMDISPETFEAPVFKIGDLFKAIFVATPVLHLQIGELVLSDLAARARVGGVRIDGVAAPVTISDVTISNLALDGLAAEDIRI